MSRMMGILPPDKGNNDSNILNMYLEVNHVISKYMGKERGEKEKLDKGKALQIS